MKRIRYTLATIALLATLVGPFLQATGLASLANGVASRHAASSFGVGQSAKPVAARWQPPCAYAGADC